jgi:hypothetical protein
VTSWRSTTPSRGFIDAAYALGLEGEPFEDHVADEGPTGFFATQKG